MQLAPNSTNPIKDSPASLEMTLVNLIKKADDRPRAQRILQEWLNQQQLTVTTQ